jgi:cbb3-type cytochrome oxidase subunit 3
MAYMSKVVAAIVILFLGLVAFVFWLSGLGEKKKAAEEITVGLAEPATGSTTVTNGQSQG